MSSSNFAKMTLFNDPGAGFWERAEERGDNSMLIGYGGLGRSDSHDPKIDGKWHQSFAAVMEETSEQKTKDNKKKATPIQPITTIVSTAPTKGKVTRRSNRINTGQTIKIVQNPPKPLKSQKGHVTDSQSDFGTGRIPKKLHKIKDKFDNI